MFVKIDACLYHHHVVDPQRINKIFKLLLLGQIESTLILSLLHGRLQFLFRVQKAARWVLLAVDHVILKVLDYYFVLSLFKLWILILICLVLGHTLEIGIRLSYRFVI